MTELSMFTDEQIDAEIDRRGIVGYEVEVLLSKNIANFYEQTVSFPFLTVHVVGTLLQFARDNDMNWADAATAYEATK